MNFKHNLAFLMCVLVILYFLLFFGAAWALDALTPDQKTNPKIVYPIPTRSVVKDKTK